MLFDSNTLTRISSGEITTAFRHWRRPTVRAGGTLRTLIGVLAIERVRPVAEDEIDEDAARAAGAGSRRELLATLHRHRGAGRRLYRIDFRLVGPDPRIALRSQDDLDEAATRELLRRVSAVGMRAAGPGYGVRLLELLASDPGRPARELAARAGRPVDGLKRDVRRLKELGLTESLGTGYRLSPRGRALVDRLRREGRDRS